MTTRTDMRGRGKGRESAYALLLVMVLAGLGMVGLSSILQWSSSNSVTTDRNVEFYETSSVAESATENVLAYMTRDFLEYGEPTVYNNLSTYETEVPTKSDTAAITRFRFKSVSNLNDRNTVTRISSWAFGALSSKYGMSGSNATYRIQSNVKDKESSSKLITAIRQDLQLAEIPIFSFGVFYAFDLEICPGASMTFNGRVHSNGDIYAYPDRYTLTFNSDVTSAGEIEQAQHPEDSTSRSKGTLVFNGDADSGVSSLTLPVGDVNTSSLLHEIIEIPPPGESPTSALGQMRYYNKADLILLVSDSGVAATSGRYNNFSVTIPWSTVSYFVETNRTFTDKREHKDAMYIRFRVDRFRAVQSTLTSLLGRRPTTVYIADLRTRAAWEFGAVMLDDGRTLPTGGLVVATPNPLYIKGHYNAYRLMSHDTTQDQIAAVACDSLTMLSDNWNDNRSWYSLYYRTAVSATVHTAVLTGNVPTQGGTYSGGYENAIRLLEDWSGDTLTFTGSMAVLFTSEVADAPWGSYDVYKAPRTRDFAFDTRLSSQSYIPPWTPRVRTVIRKEFAVEAAFDDTE